MITLKYTDGEGRTIIHETDAITLPEVIEEIEGFLKGVGYVLPEGAHLGYEYDNWLEESYNPKDEPLSTILGDEPIYTIKGKPLDELATEAGPASNFPTYGNCEPPSVSYPEVAPEGWEKEDGKKFDPNTPPLLEKLSEEEALAILKKHGIE